MELVDGKGDLNALNNDKQTPLVFGD